MLSEFFAGAKKFEPRKTAVLLYAPRDNSYFEERIKIAEPARYFDEGPLPETVIAAKADQRAKRSQTTLKIHILPKF